MKTTTFPFICFLLFLSFQSMGQAEGELKEETIFKTVDQMPLFPGCEDIMDYSVRKECAEKKMLEYIYKNTEYPAIARENGVEGTIVIRFIVAVDGTIRNAEIVRDVGGETGKEGLRVVNLMPKWNPGLQNGEAVNVYYNLPVKFRLTDEEEEIFKVVEQMPMFPGCEDVTDLRQRRECSQKKMLRYIYGNLQYPADARKERMEETVVIRFIINKDGSLSDMEGVVGESESLKAEAMRVVESMPHWNAGLQRGKPVRVWFNLPIKFRLE